MIRLIQSTILTIIIAFSGITFAAKCDGNPITKKFNQDDCDSRDVNVLMDIIEVNGLTKKTKSVFGKKNTVSLEPFDVGIQTWSYGRLISLNISGFNLEIIPESIGVLTTLEKLNLSHNKIKLLPDYFGKMKPLKYLYLSNNLLKKLPVSISKMDRLRILDLNNNKLTELPIKFGNIKSLKILNLKNNYLFDLPASFSKFRSLEKLDISNNQLSSLPDEISDLARLKKFYARNNKIKKLPENIGNLRNLEILILTGNQISQLPVSIGNCHELIIAGFNYNLLNFIPEELGKLPLLEELHCRGNKIKSVPDNYSGLNNLVKLDLSDNKLKSLPESIKVLINLEFADLSSNNFTRIPSVIPSWHRLTTLNLSHNKITAGGENLQNYPNLESLDLSYNRISKLDVKPQHFPTIIELNLSHNFLDLINWKMDKISTLRSINLSGNYFTDIPAQLCQFPQLEIQLEYNSICLESTACSIDLFDVKTQFCAEQIVIVEEVIQVIQEEKITVIEPASEKEPEIVIATKQQDKYPTLINPVKQKLFDQTKVAISEKIIPDTLFCLVGSPNVLYHVQPKDKFYNYSHTSEISVNNHTIDEFVFLETIGENELLTEINENFNDEITFHLDKPYKTYSVPARYSTSSPYYKLGNYFSWLAVGSWTKGIMLTISEDRRKLPLFLSAVYFLYLNKKLYNQKVLKYDILPPVHLKQQLSHDKIIALAETYNHKIFDEIKMMD